MKDLTVIPDLITTNGALFPGVSGQKPHSSCPRRRRVLLQPLVTGMLQTERETASRGQDFIGSRAKTTPQNRDSEPKAGDPAIWPRRYHRDGRLRHWDLVAEAGWFQAGAER